MVVPGPGRRREEEEQNVPDGKAGPDRKLGLGVGPWLAMGWLWGHAQVLSSLEAEGGVLGTHVKAHWVVRSRDLLLGV